MVTISLVVPTVESPPPFRLLQDLGHSGALERADIEVIVVSSGRETSPGLRAEARALGVRTAAVERRGQALALNHGADIADGDLVAVTDDDTRVVDPGWLDRLASHFDGSPSPAGGAVGYVAGNVVPSRVDSPGAKAWEQFGGLSKGSQPRRYTWSGLRAEGAPGPPIARIAVGANAMFPRRVHEELGGHDELFGCGSPIGHGQSLQFAYAVLHAGYTAVYDPAAVLAHEHPSSLAEMQRKFYRYGVGDTAVQAHFFYRYGDTGALAEALGGRQLRFARRLLADPPSSLGPRERLAFAREVGAMIGPLRYCYARAKQRLSTLAE